MVLYILFIILILFFLIEFYSSRDYLVSPSVVMIGSFLIATFVAVLNPQWDFCMKWQTAIIILATLFTFCVGSKIPKKIKIIRKKFIKYNIGDSYKVNIIAMHILLILQWIMLAVYILFIFQIGGGTSWTAIVSARRWMLQNNIPNIYGHINHLSFSIAAVYIYIFFRQIILDGNKSHLCKYILIIIPYILNEIVGSSRTGIIYLLGYILTLMVYFVQKKINDEGVGKKKQIKKILGIAIKVVVVTFIAFIILGYLTGKTSQLGVRNMISTYFGGSLYNLDYYIQKKDEFISPSFGYFTLPIIKSVLSKIGVVFTGVDKYYFPMNLIPTNNGDDVFSPTNLYTCITKVMTDYGFIGMLLFYLVLGIIYGIMYKQVLKTRTPGLSLIYYGFLIMPLVGASAEYLFGTMLFAPYGMYRVLYLFILFRFCICKNSNIKRRGIIEENTSSYYI